MDLMIDYLATTDSTDELPLYNHDGQPAGCAWLNQVGAPLYIRRGPVGAKNSIDPHRSGILDRGFVARL